MKKLWNFTKMRAAYVIFSQPIQAIVIQTNNNELQKSKLI